VQFERPLGKIIHLPFSAGRKNKQRY